MALIPHRESLRRQSTEALNLAGSFRPDAEATLSAFRARRDELQRQVQRGDLTPKLARRQAAEAARAVRDELLARINDQANRPGVFLDRLIRVSEARKAGRSAQSLDALQRETNRLLRMTLIEQQLANRAIEFQGKTYVRPITGGQPAPTLEGLLAFHQAAERDGDDCAREWARRQLEGLRPHHVEPEDQRRIDAACERPDRVNPRTVARYTEALQEARPEELESFVAEALASGDAGACCAAYVLARESPEGPDARWVRAVLEGLKDFPDPALEHLRAWEAESRRAEEAAARALMEHAAATAAFEARLPGLESPDPLELERRSRVASRPVAAPGEPIGLAMDRRGLSPEEYAALRQDHDETSEL